MTVHVAGNAAIDTTFVLDRCPGPGETVNAIRTTIGFGGKGLNQAVAARRAGAAVTLAAALGRDSEAEEIAALLAAEGIDGEAVVRMDGPSDRSTILIDDTGENRIVTAAARAEGFDPLTVDAFTRRIVAGDVVLLQGNLRPCVTCAIIGFAGRAGARVVLNPSPVGMEPPPVDLLVVNRPEALALSGECDPDAAALHLRRRGAGAVVVTLGAEGALCIAADRPERVAAPPVAVADTSGAGDVFCGVLCAAMEQGRDLASAVRVAVRAAAIAVSRPGTMAACPTATEIARLLSTT